jgi:hypothetical protein
MGTQNHPVCVCLNKYLNDLEMPTLSDIVQRSLAVLVRSIDVGGKVETTSRETPMAKFCCPM